MAATYIGRIDDGTITASEAANVASSMVSSMFTPVHYSRDPTAIET